jgi:hypothetical protein
MLMEPLPSPPPDDLPPDKPVPIDRWIFGQYNRLLPAKVSLRALAGMVGRTGDAVPLAEAAARIAELATRFGAYLRSLDERFRSHRDDALATAFPEQGAAGQKGQLRYQNHFVGHTVKGRPGGLLVDLKLAVIEFRKNRPWLMPTDPGWDFASLPNPLLDEPVGQRPPARFTEAEVRTLLGYIRSYVPAEVFAYRAVLSLIEQGERTPEALTVLLGRYYAPGRHPLHGSAADLVSTQRTGVIGRAADLGLVQRHRQARHITYLLTDEGRRFLADVGPLEPLKPQQGKRK